MNARRPPSLISYAGLRIGAASRYGADLSVLPDRDVQHCSWNGIVTIRWCQLFCFCSLSRGGLHDGNPILGAPGGIVSRHLSRYAGGTYSFPSGHDRCGRGSYAPYPDGVVAGVLVSDGIRGAGLPRLVLLVLRGCGTRG